MCHIELRLLDHRDTASWHIETREHGHGNLMGPRIWHAWFDHNAPSTLVSAFVTALADIAPLQRAMYDRTAHYSAVQEPSLLTPQQVVEAHAARLDALRTQARAARRPQRLATTQPKAPAPTIAAPPLRR